MLFLDARSGGLLVGGRDLKKKSHIWEKVTKYIAEEGNGDPQAF